MRKCAAKPDEDVATIWQEPDPAPVTPHAVTDRARFERLASENVDFLWRCLRRLGVPAADAEDRLLQAELAEVSESQRGELLEAYGLKEPALAVLARECYRLLGLESFFTAGEKEVRTWLLNQGGTAVEAAGNIHTDLARGFAVEVGTPSLATLESLEAAVADAKGSVRLGAYLRAVLLGHVRYYGVPMNGRALSAFRAALVRVWRRTLRRRSQRTRITAARMRRLADRWLPVPHICHPYPLVRFGVTTQGKSRMR